MAQNLRQLGEALHYLVKEGDNIKSGDFVAVGDVVGVAITDGVVGELLGISVTGVYETTISAAIGEVIQGKRLYFDAETKEITTDASKIFVGYAWDNAEAGTSVPIKLKL